MTVRKLSGKISDRIRSGEISQESTQVGRDQPEPSADAVCGAEGHGLGNGANRDGTAR